MATNLQIEDRLLKKAQRVGGFKTKKDTVNTALEEFVVKHEQMAFTQLFGTFEFASDFNHKQLRAKR